MHGFPSILFVVFARGDVLGSWASPMAWGGGYLGRPEF